MLISKRWIVLFGFYLVIFFFVLISWLPAGPVQAQLGNRGVPVRCRPDNPEGVTINGSTVSFDCVAADGTVFGGGQTVPAGYSFLVTDVQITPDRLTSVDTAYELILYDVGSNESVTTDMHLEVYNSETKSINFSTPYLILSSGHRLTGYSYDVNTLYGLHVYVSGLLVTNVTYLPGLAGN